MNQFIVELHKDISTDGFSKLAQWAAEKKYWNIISNKTISIGQMIQFLDENKFWIEHHIEYDDTYMEWGVHWDAKAEIFHTLLREELVDALWIAVKETLEA